jgi:pSer/pThr/pTyr-binding forkhead associated (FHA) protein
MAETAHPRRREKRRKLAALFGSGQIGWFYHLRPVPCIVRWRSPLRVGTERDATGDFIMATRVILTEMEGASKGQEFTFAGEDEVVIGRSSACSLRLDDAAVSRRHCLLDLGGDWAWVRDLGSRNGTFVNGQMIGRRPDRGGKDTPAPGGFRRLREGDELRLGEHAFRVSVERADLDEAAPWHADPELCEAAA